MTAKVDESLASKFVELYLSGMPANKAASNIGIGHATGLRILERRGIHIKSKSEIATQGIDHNEVIRLFNDGIGIAGIAKRFGISPGPIERILNSNGIQKRNRSQQQQARMDASSKEQIQALTKAAHDAARGRKASAQELEKRAAARVRIISDYERSLSDMLTDKGVAFGQQTAIGPYNCDFTTGSIAVEVWGGHWHWHGYHAAVCEERFRYIADRGWTIVVLCVTASEPLTIGSADYLMRVIQKASSDPAGSRKYWMVWGASETSIARSFDDDNFTIEPPFTSARDVTTGRYKRVSR